MLPADFRAPVWEFWAFWSQQLKDGQLALATRIRQWVERGLTLDDLQAAFRRVNSPGESAKHDYGGQVLAALSSAVEVAMSERRSRERREEQRREEQANRNGAVSGDELRRILSGIGGAQTP